RGPGLRLRHRPGPAREARHTGEGARKPPRTETTPAGAGRGEVGIARCTDANGVGRRLLAPAHPVFSRHASEAAGRANCLKFMDILPDNGSVAIGSPQPSREEVSPSPPRPGRRGSPRPSEIGPCFGFDG